MERFTLDKLSSQASKRKSRAKRELSADEKRQTIASNYETIEVLRDRLKATKGEQKVNMTRAAYLKMILDVSAKVDKQNCDLAKAVVEIRGLQRDVGNLSGRLDRSFALVENTMLREVKRDSWNRDCYRLLSTMHKDCDQLIQALQDIGETTRETRQLEDQIGQLKVTRAPPDG